MSRIIAFASFAVVIAAAFAPVLYAYSALV